MKNHFYKIVAFLLAFTLLVLTAFAAASTVTELFDTPGDYTYDSNKISVTGGKAALIQQTHTETTDTSTVMDAGAAVSWTTLSWIPTSPVLKNLPDSKAVESAYSSGNMNMTGNVLLLHMDETSGNLTDTSGSAYSVTASGVDVDEYSIAAKLGNGIDFDADGDHFYISGFNIPDQGTIAFWFKTGSLDQWKQRMLGVNDIFEVKILGDGKLTSDIYAADTSVLHTAPGIISIDTWYHAAWTWDSATADLEIFVDGESAATSGTLGDDWPGDTETLYIGRSDLTEDYFNGTLDEIAIFDRVLTSSEITDIYNRGAKSLKLQVRSCDDAACSGESYIGPDGTSSTYYSELTNSAVGLPSESLVGVSDNRYIQYITTLASDSGVPLPDLTSATFGPSHYDAGDPTIVNSNTTAFSTLTSFAATPGGSNAGTLKYQLSADNSNWYYHNGSAWTAASGYAQTNTAAELTVPRLDTFDDEVSTGSIYVKTFLHSENGTQQVEIDQFSVGITTSSTPTATQPASISQAADDTGHIAFSTTIDDPDNDGAKVKIEYSEDGGSTWYDAELVSAVASTGSPDLNNAVEYQIGSTTPVSTASGANSLIIVWDSKSSSNGNGAVVPEQTDIKVRVTTYDAEAGSPQASELFTISPGAAGALTLNTQTPTSLTFDFGAAATAATFAEYKIFYKAGASGVTTSDTQLVDSDLGFINYNSTTDAEITGLSAGTQYVANIWTFDSAGASTPSTELVAYAAANAPGAPTVSTAGTDSITVIVDQNSNSSSTEYAIRISGEFVQLDGTLGVSEVWRSYTDWGGASGTGVSGLSTATLYTTYVKARNGDSVETAFSAEGTGSTSGGSTGSTSETPSDPTVDDTPVVVENDVPTEPPVVEDVIVTEELVIDEIVIADEETATESDHVPYVEVELEVEQDPDAVTDEAQVGVIDDAIAAYEEAIAAENGGTSYEDGSDPTIETEEQVLTELEEVFQEITSNTSVSEEVAEIAEAIITEAVETAIADSLEGLSGPVEVYTMTSGGSTRRVQIDDVADIEIVLRNTRDEEELEELEVEAAQEGRTLLIVDEATNFDDDDVADLFQIEHGIPLFNPDADNDGYSNADEIFLGLDPTVSDTVSTKPKVTNLAGLVAGAHPSLRLSGEKNDEVSIFLILDSENEEERERKKVGETTLDEEGKGELTVVNALKNGKYYAMVEGQKEVGEVISFYVDEDIDIDAPSLEGLRLGNILGLIFNLLDRVYVAANGESFLDINEEDNRIIGFAEPGKPILVTWKSVIRSSVVISDAGQGRFEAKIPANLPEGDHEIIVYTLDSNGKKASNARSLKFKHRKGKVSR